MVFHKMRITKIKLTKLNVQLWVIRAYYSAFILNILSAHVYCNYCRNTLFIRVLRKNAKNYCTGYALSRDFTKNLKNLILKFTFLKNPGTVC